MTKLKLKKKVYIIGLILFLLILVGAYFGNKIYQDYKYKQTYEYKYFI